MTDLFSDPTRWGDMDAWRRDVVALHDEGPVHRIEAEGYDPFWAVIDHAAVHEIERRHDVFTNEPEAVLSQRAHIEARKAQGGDIRTLIHMDPPDHGKYRRLTNDWFKPASIRRMNDRLAELSAEALAKLGGYGGRCDFATDIALSYPLQVILRILGLPTDDYPRMLKLTQELFGATDPDLQRENISIDDIAATLLDFYAYFSELTADRRANPTDDLASLIANGTIDDQPMPDLETMGYYTIVATAGHDTTSAAMAVGMHQLATHPDQLALLHERPELITNAVEEMIRVASPVRHFMRSAAVDTEIAGQAIAAGDWVYLSYLGANHDPKVFDDPLRFDVERPNADRHVAFGYGIHFCLGAQLARMELRSLFSHLIPRLASVELDGEARSIQAIFVGGPKSLPIRYELR
jgi:cytochrome P450